MKGYGWLVTKSFYDEVNIGQDYAGANVQMFLMIINSIYSELF